MLNGNNEKKQWLESLQVGDSVAIRKGSFGHGYYVLDKIRKITPTRRFSLEGLNGVTFSSDGKEMGKKDTWSPRLNIEPVTQNILDDIARKKYLDKIRVTDFKDFPLETLQDIYSLIQKEKI